MYNTFYFRLRQLDMEFLKRLQAKVNIVPVIAKADTLTQLEIKKLKAKINSDIEENKIKVQVISVFCSNFFLNTCVFNSFACSMGILIFFIFFHFLGFFKILNSKSIINLI